MRFDKIIFLCNDNTSLSPMAESLFADLYQGEPIHVASRGLVVLFPAPCNSKMAAILERHGLPLLREVSTELRDKEMTDHTLVIAMSESDCERFRRRFPQVPNCTLQALAGESKDVYNPYGGELEAYELCFRDMSRMMRKAITQLEVEQKNDAFEGLELLFEHEYIGAEE